LIGGTLLTNASHGTDQLLVQRLLTCRSLRDSQKAIVASGFIVLAQFVLFLSIGIMLFAYYQHAPRPATTTNDEIFPAFIVTTLPHGISGLMIAAIFAAAMSNLSGSLNSLASTTVLDFYHPDRWQSLGSHAADTLEVVHGRVGHAPHPHRDCRESVGFGVYGRPDRGLIVYGPMLGAFLLGVLTSRANAPGVIAGMTMVASSMLSIWWMTKLA
jgi:solute:Na+ symporter, SSS family